MFVRKTKRKGKRGKEKNNVPQKLKNREERREGRNVRNEINAPGKRRRSGRNGQMKEKTMKRKVTGKRIDLSVEGNCL